MSAERRSVVCAVLVSVVALGVAADVGASFAGTDVFIPSLGSGPGASSSHWNACIWVHNPNGAPVNVTFQLLLRNQPNPSPQAFHDVIPPGDTRRYDDALATLFGVTATTFGAVRVTSPAGQPVLVNARSYSTPAGGVARDTVGQFYSAIPASFAIAAGQTTQLLGVYQTTPQDASEFRYNYGFVETAGAQATVQVAALDDTGATLASKSYTLGGYEARQYNVTDLLPQVNAANVRLEVSVTSGPGQVVAFGSGIANRSNDPSTFEMSFRPELLGGGSGITAVQHDASLQGDGTAASVLGIAGGGVQTAHLANGAVTGQKLADGTIATADLGNGVVTKAKLEAAGGNSGQVLGTNGNTLMWQDPSGFTLPYSGIKNNNADPLFYIVNTGTGPGVRSESSGGAGMYAYSNNGQEGVYGQSDRVNGYGVHGVAHNGSNGAGVYGDGAGGAGVWGNSASGFGVYGWSTSGVGVEGYSGGTTGVVGVSTAGTGVSGSGKSVGVWGGSDAGNGVEGSSGTGPGVLGSGGPHGVVGMSSSSSGHGVSGYATGSGIGVYGESQNGYAVTGYSSSQYGVKGDGGNLGVYAHNSTANGHDVYLATQALAIDAYGKVVVRGDEQVDGTLTKGGGAFKIDHPLDPANKYLLHSFVESPDMMNVYNGNVVTDDDGRAVVQLPAWFEALNRDFRYQLTVIGRFAQAIVEEEVEGNRFVIRTNLGRVKVSWQVTGIRKDPYAERHRIQVEQDKPESERGFYLHPEVYGQPEERSIQFARRPETARDREARDEGKR